MAPPGTVPPPSSQTPESSGGRPLSATGEPPSAADRAADGPLADDALVDLAAEMAASDVDEVLERLDRELVGLVPVKTRIREISSLLLIDRLRSRYQLGSARPSLHMCFTGSPGTGKTTVALRMAELLHRLGYLRRNTLVSVTRDDLVGQYIGHTAPKTREVLKRAMGGVLFIDEAYYLYRQENERDYGQETIEMLLQVMENDRDDLVVILAGYKDRMDTFFQSNPGMSSRIAHHLDFPDYTADELLAIARLMLADQGYVLSRGAEVALADYVRLRMGQPRFANARSVRNALERARLRQADRLVSSGARHLGKGDLMGIEADDILRSRVFAEAEAEAESDAAPSGDPAG
jgi:probable Rubsico expression protein CbbX